MARVHGFFTLFIGVTSFMQANCSREFSLEISMKECRNVYVNPDAQFEENNEEVTITPALKQAAFREAKEGVVYKNENEVYDFSQVDPLRNTQEFGLDEEFTIRIYRFKDFGAISPLMGEKVPVELPTDPASWNTTRYGELYTESAPIGFQLTWNGNIYGDCTYTMKIWAYKCEISEYIEGGNFCLPCPAGYTCEDGKRKTLCNGGTVANNECTKCEAGYFAQNFECHECGPGEYTDKAGETSCRECDAGYYGTGNSPSSTCSSKCPAGFKCPQGSSSPDPCPAGMSSPEGSSNCTVCGEGTSTTGQGEECQVCPAGSYSDAIMLDCQPCQGGYWGNAGATSSTCQGQCEQGYHCPAGSTSSKANACSSGGSHQHFCPVGASAPSTVTPGYFTTGGTTSATRTGQEACPSGHMCSDGIKTACPLNTYQPSGGKTSCLECDATPCAVGQYRSGCGGESEGTCQACAITPANREEVCGAMNVLVQCKGTTLTDTSRCYVCKNSTSPNDNATEAEEQFQKECKATTQTTIGFPGYVIALIVTGVTLVFIGIIAYLVRRRKAQNEKLKAIEAQAKSYEQERDLESTLEGNINPMFSKLHPDPRGASAASFHNEEVNELNEHKRKLEDELRRLKQEKQENEVDTAISAPKMFAKSRKKEFAGGKVDLQ
mmetsp:Transcript_3452/g.6622  ORF Transcript_3452/g.6622 Transcript_3452/m.6622 type:complete len:663 (+) Transcript_3452:387-2375(+)